LAFLGRGDVLKPDGGPVVTEWISGDVMSGRRAHSSGPQPFMLLL
jgi:hypothetical protein